MTAMTTKLNFRFALFLLLPVFALVSGCKDMKLDIQDSKERLEVLEGTTITTINEQITAINTSISDLKDMDSALDGYIKTLEATATDLQSQINDANAEIATVKSELGEEITALEQSLLNELTTAKEAIEAELTAIKATLDELKSADTALDKKISDLQTYVDSQLASTTDWANATFSTLTQYAETQTEISAIKASIEQTNQSLANLENSLTEKMATDIKTAIDALRTELSADYIAKMENAVNKVTEAYTSAISSAKEELTTAYTTAISTAIAESEKGMKAWVNEQLTQGYYDIATLDGMLSALSTRLDETDDDLQRQITEQQSALETAKTDLTKAYKTAISDAITENNGAINGAIAEAVQNLDDKIQARLTVIDTHISNIQKQLTNISKDIASIYEQIAGISTSISDLQGVDEELDGVIDALEAELSSLQKEFESLKPVDEPTKDALEKDITDIKALIQALQAKDTELVTQITSLQTYVNTELQKTTDWAEATFATLEQYSTVQTEIAAIKTLINKTKEEITEECTVAIETAISNCETDMKTWVNTQLAQGYYNIAAIDGKVSALETLIRDGDINLQNQIDEQKAALQQTKADLTKEYKQYIDQAIAAGGIIDQAIAAQVKTAQDNLQAQIDVINGKLDALENRLGKLEEDFVNRIQSLKYIPEYSDGKVLVSDIFRMRLTVDFIVTPSSQAETVRDAWLTNKEIVKSYLRYTKSPETRAISPAIPLEVTAIDVNETGVLTVSIAESEDNPVDADHWCKNFEGKLYLQISDGNSDVMSDFVNVGTYVNDLSEIEDISLFKDLTPLVNGTYQTANSFIINESGLYRFRIAKGNSGEIAGATSFTHPVGTPFSHDVLWESLSGNTTPQIGDVLKSLKYQDEYIYFRTSETFAKGNALVAIKDESGNILWSWHIWLTDMPDECIYNYKDTEAAEQIVVMDRNLGATATTPDDGASYGLLYQWGRKDPFIGGGQKSTLSKHSSVRRSSSTGTIEYATAHPSIFINTYGQSGLPHWMISGGSDLWQIEKTMYDPCPFGWRISDKQALYPSYEKADDDTYNGILFNGYYGSTLSVWYPAAGYMYASGAGYYGEGSYIYNWGVNPEATDASFKFDSGSWGSSSNSIAKATGCSVRCQKDM